ncbi:MULTISPECIES: GNAT family N-acetyltransferase [unclassified Nonomuraea]|uniref:GNAT family N-acetyltransferase n=1 Tax=unclassified Nonomuraea TaxID=2593643 RepID=UPI0035C07133
MIKPDYPLTTPRLHLRPFTPDDLDAVNAYESLPHVTRYLYWDARDRDTTRTHLDKRITRTAIHHEGDAIDLAITLPTTDQVIGNALLIWTSEQHRQGEIGYILHPDHHGHGYATEAARAMLHLGFTELGLHRITGRIDTRNTASARVLEKLHMRREATLIDNEIVKGEWTSETIYAILETEWTP